MLAKLLAERVEKKTDINEHLLFLRDLVNEHQVERVVEFGVRDGNSTLAFLNSTCQHLLSVDPDWHKVMDAVESAYVEAPDPKPEWRFIQSDDLLIPPVECDLLFIDSNHTSGHLRKELALHAAGVRRFIVLHDTETFMDWDQFRKEPGMRAAINAFFTAPEWTVKIHLSNCNGLTVYERSCHVKA